MVGTFVNIDGYQVAEEIYNSYRKLVYQGYQEIDSLPLFIKVLKNLYQSFSKVL